jgi:hypothetical protein
MRYAWWERSLSMFWRARAFVADQDVAAWSWRRYATLAGGPRIAFGDEAMGYPGAQPSRGREFPIVDTGHGPAAMTDILHD